MIVKIGRFKFAKGKRKGSKKLCPLSLEEVSSRNHVPNLPEGKILVKKPDYALLNVARKESIVNRMLNLLGNRNDSSNNFVILYVGNTFVGYKSKQNIRFIPVFSKKEYVRILEQYKPRKQRSKKRDYRILRK